MMHAALPPPSADPPDRAAGRPGRRRRWPAAACRLAAVLLTACAGGGGMVGQFYYEDGEFERALSAFERAVEARPQDPGAHFWLGKTRAELGDLVGARAAWDRSLELSFYHAEEIEKLRDRYWSDAQAMGQAAMEREPPDVTAALASFRNALAMHEEERESLHGLAYALARADSTAAALALYEQLARQDPSDVAAYRALSVLHLQAGRLEEALDAARQLVAYEPLDLEGLHMTSWLYERASDVGAAADMAERAASVAPDDVDNLVRLGGLYRRLGEADRAAEAFGRAVAVDPAHPGALYGRAASLSHQGRDGEALPLWELLTVRTPGDRRVWEALARIYAERGDRSGQVRARERLDALTEEPPPP